MYHSETATTGLKVSITLEPANENTSDCPLIKVVLRMIGPSHFPFIDLAPHLMGDVVRIGLNRTCDL